LVLAPATPAGYADGGVVAVSAPSERSGLGQTGGGAVQMGVYWPREVWELARSAYVADLDSDPDSPAVFARLLVAGVEQHLARTPADCAAIGGQLADQSCGRGASLALLVGKELIDAVELAINHRPP